MHICFINNIYIFFFMLFGLMLEHFLFVDGILLIVNLCQLNLIEILRLSHNSA